MINLFDTRQITVIGIVETDLQNFGSVAEIDVSQTAGGCKEIAHWMG